MGICDLIPGISGGTIAFITGIYERLINAVKNISIQNLFVLISMLFRFKFKSINNKFLEMDSYFLLILFSGILFAILLGARVIKYLLENYYIYVMAFFLGLIIASLKIIYSHIDNHNLKDKSLVVIGFLFGISFLFLKPVGIGEPSLVHVLIGGFFAISAMFLPGISGSFVLLILGLYEFIINALSDIISNLKFLFVFGIGVILGIYFISRIISFLFEKDKSKTLYALIGLVAGSLFVPVKNMSSELAIIGTSTLSILGISVFFIVGYFIVEISLNLSQKISKK